MVIETSTIITLFTLLGILGSAIAFFCKIHKWYLKQEQQTLDIEHLRQKHMEDTKKINQENQLVIYALSACLDGLSQLGANHTVPKAKQALDKCPDLRQIETYEQSHQGKDQFLYAVNFHKCHLLLSSAAL